MRRRDRKKPEIDRNYIIQVRCYCWKIFESRLEMSSTFSLSEPGPVFVMDFKRVEVIYPRSDAITKAQGNRSFYFLLLLLFWDYDQFEKIR